VDSVSRPSAVQLLQLLLPAADHLGSRVLLSRRWVSVVFATRSELRNVLFLAPSECGFFVCVWNISGTAEHICAIFTQKTCLVPLSDEFEGQGHHGRKTAFFRPFSLACLWFMFGKTSLASSCCFVVRTSVLTAIFQVNLGFSSTCSRRGCLGVSGTGCFYRPMFFPSPDQHHLAVKELKALTHSSGLASYKEQPCGL